jgi:Leucine-rich repeat (LRR) protein
VHIEKMMELEELTLGEGSDQTDKTLPHIKGLTKLRELSLKSGATTDVGMGYLKNMTGLRRLRIEGEKITAVGLQHIAGLDKLEMLSVSGCPPFVTEAGFSCVKGMKALKDLSVYNCGSPDEKASQHLKALTSLKILRFSTVQKGSLEGLRGHPCIEDLQLYYSYAGPDDIAPLIDVTTLKSLSLMNTRVTDAGLKHLKNLKQLRSLHLGETRITDAGFADLAALTGLEDLIVSENKLTGSGLKHLGSLPKLTRLSINGNPLKDEAVAALKELKNAREINLTGTRMSLEATQALKKALPKARIRDMAGDDVELTPRKKTRIVTGVDLSTRKPEFTMTAAAFHAEYKKDRTAATE